MSDINFNWPEGPTEICLEPKELHVWAIRLEGHSDREIGEAYEYLSTDERARASRFLRRADRNCYVIAHAALRKLLGKYLNCSPISIQFGQGGRGKPEVANPSSRSLHFNLSRSCGLGLIAFTDEGPVGVDIEKVRPLPEFEGIVRTHFSLHERALFGKLDQADRLPAFYVAWTLKEAFVKSTGEGITGDLASVEVDITQQSLINFRVLRHRPGKIDSWYSKAFWPAKEWAGSVAAQGEIRKFCSWRLA